MKKYLALIIIYICILCCMSCREGNHGLPEPKQEAERTVIVYMVAENSLSRFALYDSLEMAKGATQIPKDCNLLLYTDGAGLPTITHMSKRNGIRLWRKYPKDLDSTDSLTMLNTLRDMIKAFPARHYGLVLWSHASGWIPKRKTFGIDNNRNDHNSNQGTEMGIATLRGVLEQLPHMDFILSDACYMQSVEVAHELRNVTDYLIGSPSEIPGNGAPYDRIMLPMMKGDATGIAEEYYQHYSSGIGVALSVVDCHRMDSLARVTAPLVDSLWAGKAEVDTENIQRYCTFDNSLHRPEAQDIRSMMHALLPDSMFRAWDSVLLSTVIWRKATPDWESVYAGYRHHTLTDPEHYSGLSMHVPSGKYEPYGWNDAFRQTSWYRSAGWTGTGW